VDRLLEEASELSEQGNWPEAAAVVERADKLLASAGRAERPPRLLDLRQDLNMARHLEEISAEPPFARPPVDRARERDSQFAKAFQEFGIDVDALAPAEAVARIGRTRIGLTLVRTLDDWADQRRIALGPKEAGWKKLAEIARQADRDGWRNEFREAWMRNDRDALRNLMNAVRPGEMPPASLHLIGAASEAVGDLASVMRVLREAQRQYPDDVWINYTLGQMCREKEAALRYFTAACAVRPRSPGWHLLLAYELWSEPPYDADDAITEFLRVLELKPDYPLALVNLWNVYATTRQHKRGIADFSRFLERHPNEHAVRERLASLLLEDDQWDRAIAEYRKLLGVAPDDPNIQTRLGNALRGKGLLDEAISAYQEAIRRKADYSWAHYNLGDALQAKGRLDEAIAEYLEAIRLNKDRPEAQNKVGNPMFVSFGLAGHEKDYASVHNNLANALYLQGRLDEAIAEYRQALQLDKNSFENHSNLGNALRTKGLLEEAIAECREAVRLNKDFARAHCNLGLALQQQGEFREALEELRQGHELGSRDPRWPNPSAEWVRQCEHLVELDGQLPGFISGNATPASAGERLELGWISVLKHLNRAAARFYEGAFDAEPRLAENLGASHRYNAACAAALAGTGQGKDAGQLDAQERARLRRQALGWLRADLEAWGRLLDKAPEEARPAAPVAGVLQHWLVDADLAGLRDPKALARLPEAERQLWQKLWDDVTDALARAQRIATPEKK
jgi:tetratricopeptide (TPR) repeat protein